MSDSIKEHIAALREEVERQYSDRLAAISALEANLLGISTSNGNEPPEVITEEIPLAKMFANIMKVRAALSTTEFKTIRTVSRITGLDEFAVRNSLKSKTLLRQVERKKDDGGPYVFRRKTEEEVESHKGSGKSGASPSVAKAIVIVLSNEPKGLQSSEIVDRVVPIAKPKGKAPRAQVFSRLNKLKGNGVLLCDESTKTYRLAKSK